MSDGLSDGYRAARERDARQKRTDEFFGMILAHVQGGKPAKTAFREAFDAFEAYRWSDSMARYRLEKEVGKRWEIFLDRLDQAAEERDWTSHMQAWAEILSLAMRFASASVVESLHDASAFKNSRITLYVPNGTDHHGWKRPPTLYGDHADTLDSIAAEGHTLKNVRVLIVDDPDRAVVGLRTGNGTSTEVLEPERAKLRFLAVFGRKAG